MAVRLGDLLVQRGALTPEQRDEVVAFQRLHGRPFGLLAEQMFGVHASAVEMAWAEQYAEAAEHIERQRMIPTDDVIDLIDRRQAWQFGIFPLRFADENLVVATSTFRLAKAMRFTGWRVPYNCEYVICSEGALRDALAEHFPIPGMETALSAIGQI